MLCQNDKIELRAAVPGDMDGIRKVFLSGKFDGEFCVQFLREPDPLVSLRHDGDSVVMIVMEYVSTREIIAVAGCVIRREYAGGTVRRIGYLTGLKILPEYQKKVYCIADGYQLIRDLTKEDVDIYYTTILSSNSGAIKLLEKKHKRMPSYHFLGEYTTYCIKGGGKERGTLTGLTAQERETLYQGKVLPGLDFSPSGTALYQLKDQDFIALRGRDNEILAACAIYDQQAYKKYVISGYNRKYKLLSKLPTRWLGFPAFPKENSELNYASVAFLYVKDHDPELGRKFLRAAAAHSSRYEILLAGLFENNTDQEIFASYKHVKFKSRLYEVTWEEPQYQPGNPVGLEVSLL